MNKHKRITCMLSRVRGSVFKDQSFSIRKSVLSSIKTGVEADSWPSTGEETFFVLINITNLLK